MRPARSTARTSTASTLLALLVWAGPGAAQVQGGGSTVYRCGEGQYSQTPCPGGRPLDTGPAPTPQQQAEARAAAATDAKLAEQLRQERHAREKAARGQQPARIGPPPEGSPTTKAKRPQTQGDKPPKPRKPPKPPKPPEKAHGPQLPKTPASGRQAVRGS